MHGDLAKEPKGLCLEALLLMLSRVCQGALRQLTRFCHAARQQIRLTATEDGVSPERRLLQQ
jgi:hypothetical protein